MKLIDLDGNTWDGTKLNSKYKPVYDRQGRNEMMGVTLGWLYDAPEFDLEKNNVEIRNKAIDDFAEKLSEVCDEQSFEVSLGAGHFTAGLYADVLTLDGLAEIICDVAEQLKKGDADNE